MWGYTLTECQPYIETCVKNVLFRDAMLAFLGIDTEKIMSQTSKSDARSIGGYCKGMDVEECKKYFGEKALKRLCATCPN